MINLFQKNIVSVPKTNFVQLLDVYVAELPENVTIAKVYPEKRDAEIAACSHERVKLEKYCVWRLLEQAVCRSFGMRFDKLQFEKSENGKWTCPELFFSLSHSHGLLAVAVSQKPVGVDIELVDGCHSEGLRKKILTDGELAEFYALTETERPLYFTEKWTGKESEFKKSNAPYFSPATIEIKNTVCRTLERASGKFVLAVSGDDLEKMKIYENVAFLK